MALLEELLAANPMTVPSASEPAVTPPSFVPQNSALLDALSSQNFPALRAPANVRIKEAAKDFAGNFLFTLGEALKAGATAPGGRGTQAGMGAAFQAPMVLQQIRAEQARKQQEDELKTAQFLNTMRQQGIQNAIAQRQAAVGEGNLAVAQQNANKPPAANTPFEVWRQQNPGASIVDWLKLQNENKPESTPAPAQFNVNVDGKPAVVLRDTKGNYVYADTKQPVTGRITPYIAPPTPRQRGEITPTAEAGLIQQLNGQWQKASKDVQELYRANTIMDAGLAAARRGDMNQGSQAILVTFQKFLDPTSVVRESEYARSGEGLAMAERVRGYIDRLARGGAGVTLPELEKFAQIGREINNRLTAEGNSLLSAERKRIGLVSDRFGIPIETVVPQYDYSQPAGSPKSPQKPSGETTVSYGGKTYKFPSKTAADGFKKEMGIK